MYKSFDLGNEFTKTFRPSHKRTRTQEVNSNNRKKGEEEKREKRKKKKKGILTTKKNIKLVNSPATTPKT